MTRRYLYLLLALPLLALLVWGFLPKPLAVDTALLQRGVLEVTVEEEGKTRIRERYVVAAPVNGHARRITLKQGDSVVAGQVVAHIEPARANPLDPRAEAQARAHLKASEALWNAARELARAGEAETRLAEQELARTEMLGQAQFLPPQAVDQARARLQSARASLAAAQRQAESARHDRDAARAALNWATAPTPRGLVAVTAPQTGRILTLSHESEGAVTAGQPLLTLGDPASLEVEVEMLSTAAVKIAPGTEVRLDRWGGDVPLRGRVRLVEPAGYTKVSALGVEEQRVRVIIDLVSPPRQWQRLGDGYRVEAAFVIWRGQDVAQIPTSALFRQGEGWAAFVVEDGRARVRPLRIGQQNGLASQVLDGLKPGETVILHPDSSLADGQRVRARTSD